MAGFFSGFEFVRRLFIPSDGRVSFRNLGTDKINLSRLFYSVLFGFAVQSITLR